MMLTPSLLPANLLVAAYPPAADGTSFTPFISSPFFILSLTLVTA
jgi:hypothetical protein